MSDTPDPFSLTPYQWIRSQRDFLHDMATPLMIAQGHLETSLENDPENERLQKALKNVKKMGEKLKERRSHLIEMTKIVGEPSGDE